MCVGSPFLLIMYQFGNSSHGQNSRLSALPHNPGRGEELMRSLNFIMQYFFFIIGNKVGVIKKANRFQQEITFPQSRERKNMPNTDIYITNGGYGGVLLGIEHGLPMIAAGINEGKNEICARIGFFKLGINLKTEKPSAQKISESVKKILSDPRYKKNVSKLSDEFNRYDTNKLCANYILSASNGSI